MDENQIFDKINKMLEDTGYPMEIKDVSDLEDFLNDEENMKFEQYESIARIYDELIDEPEYEDYTEQ